MKVVLTIAGFDPSSGAGVTADLMVFAAHGLFGTSCITALTVQSTLGVQATYPVSEGVVGETLQCLDADLRPVGIKIGMVASEPNIHRISDYLEIIKAETSHVDGVSEPPVVVDPVIRSSSGRELLDASGLAALQERLLPLADWITPNLDELAVLLKTGPIARREIPDACHALQFQVTRPLSPDRPLGIIATGGHLDTPDDFLLMPTGEDFWLPGERVATESNHGTGCAFSSAFLSRLVLGDEPRDAALAAKGYVSAALKNCVPIGNGSGPINHLWNLLHSQLYV